MGTKEGGPSMKAKHGIRGMGSEGTLKSDNNNMKGEVRINNNGVMNRDVCVCLCAG